MKKISKEDLVQIFAKIEEVLEKKNRSLSITTIGGASIILQGIRDRMTLDIDIANNQDALFFQKICSGLKIPVDIVTVASTVDLEHAQKIKLFDGKKLTVYSVLPEDLLKLKLERFRKQDPEDIYAIIGKTNLSYENFKAIVKDMLPDFIGNPRELILRAYPKTVMSGPRARRGGAPKTGTYMEIREDFGVPQRSHWVAQ